MVYDQYIVSLIFLLCSLHLSCVGTHYYTATFKLALVIVGTMTLIYIILHYIFNGTPHCKSQEKFTLICFN